MNKLIKKQYAILTGFSDGGITVKSEVRPIKELYQILLEHLKEYQKNKRYVISVCNTIKELYYQYIINSKELILLRCDFRSRRPTIFSKFYWNNSFINNEFWWKLDKKGLTQRIKFIQNIINKLR